MVNADLGECDSGVGERLGHARDRTRTGSPAATRPSGMAGGSTATAAGWGLPKLKFDFAPARELLRRVARAGVRGDERQGVKGPRSGAPRGSSFCAGALM